MSSLTSAFQPLHTVSEPSISTENRLVTAQGVAKPVIGQLAFETTPERKFSAPPPIPPHPSVRSRRVSGLNPNRASSPTDGRTDGRRTWGTVFFGGSVVYERVCRWGDGWAPGVRVRKRDASRREFTAGSRRNIL